MTTGILHPWNMSYSLISLKGSYIEDHIGEYQWGIEGDTRSSDYNSYGGVCICKVMQGCYLYIRNPKPIMQDGVCRHFYRALEKVPQKKEQIISFHFP